MAVKNTLVFGASLKPERYSNRAIHMLLEDGHPVRAIGARRGAVAGVEIMTGHPPLDDIHTITIYMGEARQKEHEEYLLSLKPSRIIFNPGAENRPFMQRAKAEGIETLEACTLVMIRIAQY